MLVVGSAESLPPLRFRLSEARTPIVLVGGDLYTSRSLFADLFQTSIPWEWQARVIARYLVVDRLAATIGFGGFGPQAPLAAESLGRALRYWGADLADAVIYPAGPDLTGRLPRGEAVVTFGEASQVGGLAGRLARRSPRPRIVSSATLLALPEGTAGLLAGTAACYAYTWAGWAHPIARVGTYADRFASRIGEAPIGLSQEGYDAVRLLADGLDSTFGRGGSDLLRALESTRDRIYSGFPIDLGPDDHVFLPRDELGLFAVAGKDERLDPWQAEGSRPWRPVMRTFTYDGERDNILDIDRRVFFPRWRKNQPGPFYFRSRYGIVSRPSDPLH